MSGKKFADALKKFDREFMYAPKEAVTHAKNTATAAFDESIDVVIRLGVDPRKADQMVRGTVRPSPLAPARTCGSPSSPLVKQPRPRARRVPILWVPTIYSNRSTAA